MKNTCPLAALTVAVALATSVGCSLSSASTASSSEAAAGDDDGEHVGATTSALVADNGQGLNGQWLNGHKLNGITLNGHKLNGHKLNGRTLEGVSVSGVTLRSDALDDVHLDATWLAGRASTGRWYWGSAFEGARMTGLLDDDSTIPIRIDAIDPSTRFRDWDVNQYTLSYFTDEGWQPYCGLDDAGAPVKAIPLAGRWSYGQGVANGGARFADDTAITFACQGYVLAKCVEAGYKPWSSVIACTAPFRCGLTRLKDHHQACTRMLRADYCGDGTPNTVDGTLINIYDGIGIQRDTDPWTFEAEWTTSGARCVDRGRVGLLPPCAAARADATCGAKSHFQTGTLLMTEDHTAAPIAAAP